MGENINNNNNNNSNTYIEEIRLLQKQLDHNNNTREILEKCKKCIANNIKLLNKFVKIRKGCINTQKRFTAYLGVLQNLKIKCTTQLKKLSNNNALGAGLRTRTRQNNSEQQPRTSKKSNLTSRVIWKDIKSAFLSRIRTGAVINLKHKDPREFLKDAMVLIKNRLKNLSKTHKCFKAHLCLCGEFILPSSEEKQYKYIGTKNEIFLPGTDYDESLGNLINEILVKLEEFQERKSGWALVSIVNLVVSFVKYCPLNGGSSTYMDLPHFIRKKSAVLNIINKYDKRCFGWSIIAALHPCTGNNDPTSIDSYPQNMYGLFNFHGLEFPMQICNMSKFEKQNAHLSINIYSFEEEEGDNHDIYPVYISLNKHGVKINLLYISKYHKNNGHYCLITDLNKLCFKQLSKFEHKKFICNRCLNFFNSCDKLNSHLEQCCSFSAVRVEIPEKGSFVKFKNFNATLKLPYVIYADFEAFTTPVSTCNDDPTQSYTNAYQKHLPFSVAYFRVCSYDSSLNYFNFYRANNPEKWFVDQILNEASFILKKFKRDGNKSMKQLSPNQKVLHDACSNCSICNSTFSDENPKVAHHCHFTGNFLCTLCNNCNLQCKHTECILPIFFHNLSRYDSHFIIETLANVNGEPVHIIPTTTETYIAFTKKYNGVKLRFLDSFRFMPSSLEKLVANLTDIQMTHTKSAFPIINDFNLVRRKGIFPYDYVNCSEKLEENCLPKKEDFYSKLNDTDVSDDDYSHAHQVWTNFKCQSLGDYADIYLKTDVYLLADVFENYRDLIFKTYGLDACAFYTAPGLAISAALIVSKVKLELLYDVDMVLFFENGLRGGICQVSCKYAKSNSPYSPKYDTAKETCEILYVDANGLYSFAMTSSLPCGDFRWLDDLETLRELIIDGSISESYGDNLQKSCILECDIEYPAELHDEHMYFPFCPEHVSLTGKKADRKLMLTLNDKKKYILHINVLIQCLSHGLILTKIHRAIEFSQSPWLKKFIDLNANLRAKATNEFDKQQYKDFSNMCFGKMMESVRKYREIQVTNNWLRAKKIIASPNFKKFTIFNENLVAVELNKKSVKYDKALYVGTCILDISKTVMYSFVYDYIKCQVEPHFKTILCYTDTDSFIAKFSPIKNGNFGSIYDLIRRDAQLMFDTSDYSENNQYGIPLVNKKVIGKFKDELKGQIINEYVGIRAKVYAIDCTNNEKVIKRHKGIGKCSVEKLTFEDYKNAIFHNISKMCNFNTIRSKNHNLYSLEVNKVALQNYDDKRKQLEDNINSIPWGHYSIE